jgi:uncharacterized membrane protein HdeD (DUF308 family)
MSATIGPDVPQRPPAARTGDLAGAVSEAAGSFSWALIAAGVVAVVCGIIAVAWPSITLTALAIVAGIELVCLGALGIAGVFGSDGDAGARALSGVLGLFGVIAGVTVIRRPGQTLLVIILAVGLLLLLAGIVEVVRGLAGPGPRGLALVTGAVDVILGILILSWPKLTLGTLAVLAGIAFIIRGGLLLVRGVQLRRAAKAMA